MPPDIVLVDDDPLVCDIVSATLVDAGYTIEAVEDGADAVDVIWEAQPRLVILDCALPGRPGMAVLQELRASPMFRTLPIIVLTARRSDWHEHAALDSGASAYVRKPFDPQALLITVAKLMRGTQAAA